MRKSRTTDRHASVAVDNSTRVGFEAVPGIGWQRLLVPVDFSAESRRALHCAAALAAQFDASLTLVHVVEPALYPPELSGVISPSRASEASWEAEAKTRLNVLGRQMLGPCRVVETVIRNGLAFFEITETAKALNADLIVIGTHGYTGFKRALLGSTAEKVVRHAPCHVLVVRHQSPETTVEG
jgi:nucleotide-binding universal stress UspA family protein